jgi:branched-chain amino acid transport system ATP-binding protein
VLEIEDLHVAYGPVKALRGLSIKVGDQETVAVLGANGAGKSTLMLTISGVLKPTAGRVILDGEDITGQRPEAIVRKGIAHVPEARHIFASLTVEQNLRLGASIRRDSGAIEEDLANVRELFPALDTYYRSSAAGLSGGEQQMLAVGRALLSRPRLLLLDEPSLGLAPVVVDRLFEALEKLREDGVTILLVEQAATRALQISDRIYAVRGGQVHLEGKAEEVGENPEFESIYLGTA